jgi:acetyl-CoA acetyltransferase
MEDPQPDRPAGLLVVEAPGRRGPVLVEQDAWTDQIVRTGQAPPADGAAALVLASEAAGTAPLARILGFSSAASGALEGLCLRAGVAFGEIRCFVGPDHLLAVGGAPLLVDMLGVLRLEGRRYGAATLSSGDGQSLSLLLELL